MAPEVTPDEIRAAQFRVVMRGLDRGEVEKYLGTVARRMATLESELARAKDVAAGAGEVDLESEFNVIGQEVTSILQAAREAAEAMRERASIDAARWRTEAIAESEVLRRDSAADAEALRRDAWTVGTEILEQAASHSKRITEQAERDVLTAMGEAEREAHRLTSGARREAEDLVRNATMAAEKMTAEATRRRDDIIDAATRQASVAQERTRALEQRRDELLEELESVRATLNRLEGSLDQKLHTIDPESQSSSVRVVPSRPAEEPPKQWELGETVRLIQPDPRATRPPDDEADDSLVVVRTSDEPETETEPVEIADQVEDDPPEVGLGSAAEAAPEPEVEPEAEPLSEPDPEPVPVVAFEQEPGSDVDSLFASLRGGSQGVDVDEADTLPATAESEPDPDPEPEPEAPAKVDGRDWIEERDSRLLPITNRALRGTKKSITELQNIALDKLRTDPDWRPDPASDADTLAADLITVWAESFAAGHAVAEEMTGGKLKRPPTPHSAAVEEFPAALSQAVASALDGAGSGQRERQSAASKVYRVWRSDEAEQRIREIAIRAYQQGIEKSVSSAD